MSAERVVAFQGMLGAFSHLACRATHPDWTVLPCPTFDSVFDAVESGAAARAVIPVENSQAGRVTDIHRLLPQRGLFIVGEHFQPIHHQLVAIPGTKLADVRTVRSHPQALAQCREYLNARNMEAVAARDTAEAAVEVGRLGDKTIAAIASRVAAEIHGLEILDQDIEDAHDNTTRFLVMSPTPVAFAPDAGPLVTSCLFRVRNIPAALYKALGGFATNGVNLLKLESYQLGGFQWAQFVVDLEGHPDDPAVARALEELSYFATELRLLGTFPAAPRPDQA